MIYALCSNPQVSWLTDGKRYEVIIGGRGWFYFVDDNASPAACYWNGSSAATWERIEENNMTEETEAPEWALDEAAKAAGYRGWAICTNLCEQQSKMYQSVKAHALTIARHETPPDPDLEKARELVKEHSEGLIEIMEQEDAEQAILAAMKWARSNTKEPIQ